jgi:hypothetical protein
LLILLCEDTHDVSDGVIYVFKYLTTSSHLLCYLPTGQYLCWDGLQRWNAPSTQLGSSTNESKQAAITRFQWMVHWWLLVHIHSGLALYHWDWLEGNTDSSMLSVWYDNFTSLPGLIMSVWLVIISITDAKVQIQPIPQRKSGVLLGLTKYPESHKKGGFLFVVATLIFFKKKSSIDLYYYIFPFLVPQYWGII